MHDQLSSFMDEYFNPFLAALRKDFGCQSTLLRLLEDWRKALPPHGLLIAKLRAYGLSKGAVELLEYYLIDRSQQVRLGTFTSTWEKLFKGIPQGSILGPLLLNIF